MRSPRPRPRSRPTASGCCAGSPAAGTSGARSRSWPEVRNPRRTGPEDDPEAAARLAEQRRWRQALGGPIASGSPASTTGSSGCGRARPCCRSTSSSSGRSRSFGYDLAALMMDDGLRRTANLLKLVRLAAEFESPRRPRSARLPRPGGGPGGAERPRGRGGRRGRGSRRDPGDDRPRGQGPRVRLRRGRRPRTQALRRRPPALPSSRLRARTARRLGSACDWPVPAQRRSTSPGTASSTTGAADAEAEESGRLAYVAASRARTRLLLSAAPSTRRRRSSRSELPLRRRSVLGVLIPALGVTGDDGQVVRAEAPSALPGVEPGRVRSGADRGPGHRRRCRIGARTLAYDLRGRGTAPAATRRQTADAGPRRARRDRGTKPLLRGPCRLRALRLPLPGRARPSSRRAARTALPGDPEAGGAPVGDGLRAGRPRAARVVGAELVAAAGGGPRRRRRRPRGIRRSRGRASRRDDRRLDWLGAPRRARRGRRCVPARGAVPDRARRGDGDPRHDRPPRRTARVCRRCSSTTRPTGSTPATSRRSRAPTRSSGCSTHAAIAEATGAERIESAYCFLQSAGRPIIGTHDAGEIAAGRERIGERVVPDPRRRLRPDPLPRTRRSATTARRGRGSARTRPS